MTAAVPIVTDLLDDIEEQSERALRDHAAALNRGVGFADRGLVHLIGTWLKDGEDPDDLVARSAAVLLRDAYVGRRDLSAEDATAQAAQMVAREQRRGGDQVAEPATCSDDDALVAAAIEDPGAPFRSEWIDHLVTLREYNPAAFESLRAKLKKHGVRVGQLDRLLAERLGDQRGQRPTQADVLIGLSAEASLWHTADFTAYADFDINGHRETWPIRSKGFKRWITKLYFEQTGSGPSSEALKQTIGTLEAKAHFDAEPRQIYTRVAPTDGAIFLDLGTDGWTVARTVADGWEIIDRPPVRFRRAAGVQPHPTPIRGGSIAALRAFLNVDDDAFTLIVAWLLTALRGRASRRKGPL